ncbi:hypothetical protein GQR58_015589 [Nymphon striatum]|nr:hypothetical protein GQR58_015589 [Nymphon striatum]
MIILGQNNIYYMQHLEDTFSGFPTCLHTHTETEREREGGKKNVGHYSVRVRRLHVEAELRDGDVTTIAPKNAGEFDDMSDRVTGTTLISAPVSTSKRWSDVWSVMYNTRLCLLVPERPVVLVSGVMKWFYHLTVLHLKCTGGASVVLLMRAALSASHGVSNGGSTTRSRTSEKTSGDVDLHIPDDPTLTQHLGQSVQSFENPSL